MKRLALIALLGCALAGPSVANAVQGNFKLGTMRARSLMRTAMLEDNRLGFRAKAGGYVRCNKRITRSRVKCKMAWVVGDAGFSGRGTVWITERGGELYWHRHYKLLLLDEYCASVEPGSDCTRTIVSHP